MKQQSQNRVTGQIYKVFALAEQRAQNRSWTLLTQEDVSQNLGLNPQQVFRLFTRLMTEGRIQRLQRGLYMFPGRLPPGKLWRPSAYEAVVAFMSHFKANWQITGLDAFARYGFTTQIAQRISIYNDYISGEKEIAGNHFSLIKIKKETLGHTAQFSMGDNILFFSSCGRALFDAVYEASRFNTLPEAYGWIASLKSHVKVMHELIECCIQYGNKLTQARIGYFLEKLGYEVSALYNNFSLNTLKTNVSFVPGKRAGTINKKWGIIENYPLSKILKSMEIPDEDDTE